MPRYQKANYVHPSLDHSKKTFLTLVEGAVKLNDAHLPTTNRNRSLSYVKMRGHFLQCMRGVEVINFAQALYLKRRVSRGYEAEKKLHFYTSSTQLHEENERALLLHLLLLHKCVTNIVPPKVQLS